MSEIDVTEFEEFEQLVDGKSESTKNHYKSSLQKFCNFHNMTPRELILEARNYEPEDENRAHLEKNPAEKKLSEWYSHTMERDIAESTGAVYWRHIRAFYRKFDIKITIETPKASNKNEKPDYSASDIKKMVDVARCPRDRAIILCSFQGGMGPTEICRLDYEQVKHGLENNQNSIPVWKTRKKSGVSHHTWLLRDAVEALKMYLNQRKRELEDKDPLFVKKNNGERIEPRIIQNIMRGIRDRAIGEIEEAQRIDSDINPLSLKYLRRAFGIACDKANVDRRFKEYWLGHTEPYKGAYNSGQISIDEQEKELEKLKTHLRVSTRQEEIDEEIEDQKEEIIELREETVNQKERIEKEEQRRKELEKNLEELEEKIEKIDQLGELLESEGKLSDIETVIGEKVEEALRESQNQ